MVRLEGRYRIVRRWAASCRKFKSCPCFRVYSSTLLRYNFIPNAVVRRANHDELQLTFGLFSHINGEKAHSIGSFLCHKNSVGVVGRSRDGYKFVVEFEFHIQFLQTMPLFHVERPP